MNYENSLFFNIFFCNFEILMRIRILLGYFTFPTGFETLRAENRNKLVFAHYISKCSVGLLLIYKKNRLIRIVLSSRGSLKLNKTGMVGQKKNLDFPIDLDFLLLESR